MKFTVTVHFVGDKKASFIREADSAAEIARDIKSKDTKWFGNDNKVINSENVLFVNITEGVAKAKPRPKAKAV
ncbi:hypothetical protein ACFQ3W_08215 [Paenibacillus puldeungensis]|uniref:Uncharacterized protein n=1 Tax=Paenibacillus puldeungensis TaxID=696536 RepID=A0ABW3RVH1_9BACL